MDKFYEKGEFNPIHSHSGDISFVIYISVPHEIVNECKIILEQVLGQELLAFYLVKNQIHTQVIIVFFQERE